MENTKILNKIRIKYNDKIYEGQEGIRELLRKIYREALEIPDGYVLAVLVRKIKNNVICIDTDVLTPSTDITYTDDLRSPSAVAWIIYPPTDVYEDVEYDDEAGVWRTWTGEKITEEEIIENFLYWTAVDVEDDFVAAIKNKAEEIKDWLRNI